MHRELKKKKVEVQQDLALRKLPLITKMLKTPVSRLGLGSIFRRLFSVQSQLRNSSRQSSDYLNKFYSPEVMQSIKIAESLVDPQTYVNMKLKARKSKVAPESGKDYNLTDPKWEEPILYPNQGENATPYPPIPREAFPDTSALRLRMNLEKDDRSDRDRPSDRSARDNKIDRVAALTGFDREYIRKLHVVNVLVKRVSCQTSKGKIPNFYVMTIVGDRNGMVGMGEGKSRHGVRIALDKGWANAVKNLSPIPRYENRTIVGDKEHKYHAVKLFLKSAPAGFGLRVNPVLFEVCEAAGIKDLKGKIYKSRNRMNVVKGFLEALRNERSIEDVAAGRGKKIVDLRKVYYSA